ncbi:MAG: 3'(2'),5'-bisphosphate nucleotidase CysQ, partial [Alphaproteobacteria bacterium]|nr:3'(2'),5'-bisphosphate nucleotidase CysQ [Alphaproteobacteria bacterium]
MAMALWHEGESRVKMWEKSPGQLVCEVDIEADRLLRERLGAIDPGAAWLSEEVADDLVRLHHDRIWVVDPIDGTRDYLRGRPGWAVSVALVEHGEPVLGLLAAPARGEMWMAQKGKGAWRNDIPLVASSRST